MADAEWVMLTHRNAVDGARFFETKKEALAERQKKLREGYTQVEVVSRKQLCADPDPNCEDDEAELEAMAR